MFGRKIKISGQIQRVSREYYYIINKQAQKAPSQIFDRKNTVITYLSGNAHG